MAKINIDSRLCEEFRNGDFRNLTLEILTEDYGINAGWYISKILEGCKINYNEFALFKVILACKANIRNYEKLFDEALKENESIMENESVLAGDKKFEEYKSKISKEKIVKLRNSVIQIKINSLCSVIRFCAKKEKSSRMLFDELLSIDNEEVHLCCCANYPIGYYDFSQDKFKRVRALNEHMQTCLYLWRNDRSFNLGEKANLFIFMRKLNCSNFRLLGGKNDVVPFYETSYNEEEKCFEVWYMYENKFLKDAKFDEENKFGRIKIYCDEEYFQLLMDCDSELNGLGIYDNSLGNVRLSLYRASLICDLIRDKKIEFIDEEPPFITKMRDNGMSRKLVNHNV